MDKVYKHQDVEKKWYTLWEKGGYFTPRPPAGGSGQAPKKKPFTIIMPPPNANDPLHIGHAMFVTIEDILIRYYRMKGNPTLWLPGSDHAGIETQYVFEKKLQKEGKSRFDFTREEFYKTVYNYVMENTGIMTAQLRKLGASCDWTRFKFTLDSDIVKIVYETFYQLYRDGHVYRSERMINFCPRCGTAFSDLEAKDVVQKDPLYYMKYGPFTLATVRPETKFGDTAVAVNPSDKRYKKWIGKEVEVEGLMGKFTMRVIADEVIDPKFGTGVIKVTPAHDPDDFEIAKRHNLEIRRVIDFNGRLNEKTGKYQGLTVKEARKVVVSDLEKKGLIEKIDENYEHSIKVCYRCGMTLEPMLLPQWFVKVDELKKPAMEVVKKGDIEIIPKRFTKQYLNWMTNLRDWNISRQIWWGIAIPAWYCTDCTKIEKIGGITSIPKDAPVVVQEEKPKKCHKCGGTDFIQDPDTFDTWFSSGQWPYATLMTAKPNDFDSFYPTSVMETAADILYLWVARMIMLGIYKTGKIPFHTVYLHAIVRDKHGQKISKSKGNIIDPIEMAEKYGADALRLALIWGIAPGGDSYMGEEKILGMRNFGNKLWNIGRFIRMNMDFFEKQGISIPSYSSSDERSEESRSLLQSSSRLRSNNIDRSNLSPEDKKILTQLGMLERGVTKEIENFQFAKAAERLYEFIWHTFADKYIEEAKVELRKNNAEKLSILIYVYKTCLTLLHPFMPFITEEIFRELNPNNKNPLIASVWPNI
ncbi:valine--tRNA ligase [Candidatus Gottesmanbacteria bacterium]|nr:valine--tRNA ligase [Candidatus Gottesmanbacteria bacterium]